MKNILLTLLVITISTPYLASQINCSELMEYVKDKGDRTNSYCCFDSEFLTNVDFYSLDIDYETFYFAVVTIDFYKTYIYCIPYSAVGNFGLYAFTDQAGEAFHAYIRDHKCNCY